MNRENAPATYRFGPFRVEAAERLLTSGEKRIPLPPKAFETLLVLLERRGSLVTKDELLERVWPDTHVTEATLAQNIFTLRKALENGDGADYIETVPKQGYRFTGPATPADDRDGSAAVAAPPPARRQWAAITASAGIAVVALAAAMLFLRDGSRGEAAPQIRSLAVLPFRVVVGQPSDGPLGVALTDAVIAHLARQLRAVAVRPATSVLPYADREMDALEAGRKLRVDAVLEGTIQNVGDRMRVRLRLIRVEDGSTIWADTLDGHSGDLFAVEDEISRRAARHLTHTLAPAGPVDAGPPTANADAYRAYLLGRYFWTRRRAEGGVKDAVRHYLQAIELDPRFANAYAGIAQCYALFPEIGAPEQGVTYARRALELSPELADAHAALAILAMKNLDWKTAEHEYRDALALDPGNVDALSLMTMFLVAHGRFDEAIARATKAVEVDPTSPTTNMALGVAYLYANRFGEAIEQLKRTVALDPHSIWGHLRLGQAYLYAGVADEAILAFEQAGRLNRNLGDIALAQAYGMLGQRDKALERLARAESEGSLLYRSAAAWAAVGEADRAFEHLEKAYRQRHYDLYAVPVDPRLRPLHSDPRFKAFVAKLGLPFRGAAAESGPGRQPAASASRRAS